ncbi:MAG: hypothetical protein RIG63_13235 [Coleofasciculus chthonoplastes F3-SA18-01]|jgi:hypothetical protein|uniref:hypothetical protein n=1 Tax=Coleofasciculus chthonoplastes TaxID=64178 RepID=UPI0032F20521
MANSQLINDDSELGGKLFSLPPKEGGLPAAFGKDRQNTMALPSLIVRLSLVKVGKFPEPFLDRG